VVGGEELTSVAWGLAARARQVFGHGAAHHRLAAAHVLGG
jgi:hypothetical protein